MEKSKDRNLARAAIIVMTAIVLSRILGFLRTTLITNILSVDDKDAIFMAFQITDVMFMLLIGGSISSVLIPMLTRFISNGEEKEGWKAISSFINVMFIAITVLCGIGIIFAHELIDLVAAGFGPVKAEVTVQVTRIMFPSVAFMMLTGLVNGVSNSYRRFAAAAYGSVIYNILCIISIIFLSRYGVKMVAVGILSSAVLYFLIQLIFALNILKYYRPGIHFRNPDFKRLVLLSIPSLLASSISQINILVSQSYNSFFSEGSVTALRNASDIWQLPYGIFAMGLGVAILPSLSEMLIKNDLDSYKRTLTKSLKSMLLVIIPAAIGLAVIGTPVASVIYKWSIGMKPAAISTTGQILTFFTIALVSQSIVAIINRAYYANNDTKTPLYIGVFSIVLNALFCYLLFKLTNLDSAGMALAYSISSAVYAFMMLFVLNKKMGGLKLNVLFIFIAKVVVASLIMAVFLFAAKKLVPVEFTQAFTIKTKIIEILILGLEIGAGLIIFMTAAILMKVEEALYLYTTVIGKVKRIFHRQNVKEIGKM